MPGEFKKEGETPIINLVVPATAEYLAMLRLVVGAAAKVAGFNDEHIADIKVALSEASTNVVKHAYERDCRQCDRIIEVSCYDLSSSIAIEVVDHGNGMPLPPPASKGLGFGIMGSLMDKVNVETDQSGTSVLLVKEFDSARTG